MKKNTREFARHIQEKLSNKFNLFLLSEDTEIAKQQAILLEFFKIKIEPIVEKLEKSYNGNLDLLPKKEKATIELFDTCLSLMEKGLPIEIVKIEDGEFGVKLQLEE
ncbi:MAG: hypothetical protein A2539_01020 [Elusimicrobia bacterium RIFOXYD2_FULL_34_15]|nr:MAG: hypothetical protein A2539_01020 [Elusimicrobia bacterium RIFOXYD2_FULL_34_15]